MTPHGSGVESSPVSKIKVEASKTIARTPKVSELAEPKVWNTKNLGLRLATDFTAGFSAAVLVAPLITIIDKYVILVLQKLNANKRSEVLCRMHPVKIRSRTLSNPQLPASSFGRTP